MPDSANSNTPTPKKVDNKLNPNNAVVTPGVSLAQLLKDTKGAPSPQELTNQQNAHRVLVITSVAKVDENLLRLLRSSLAPANDTDDLLDEGSPLGTLRLRAKLCMRLRLISPSLYSLIKELSEVRNYCSHKPDEFNVFADQSIRDKISNHWNRLNPELFEPKITEPEERFKIICSYINIYLEILTRGAVGGVFRNSEALFVNNK